MSFRDRIKINKPDWMDSGRASGSGVHVYSSETWEIVNGGYTNNNYPERDDEASYASIEHKKLCVELMFFAATDDSKAGHLRRLVAACRTDEACAVAFDTLLKELTGEQIWLLLDGLNDAAWKKGYDEGRRDIREEFRKLMQP